MQQNEMKAYLDALRDRLGNETVNDLVAGNLEKAISAQLSRSREDFDHWFEKLDFIGLLTRHLDAAAPTNPLMIRQARTFLRKILWSGWSARDPELTIYHLKAAAAEDVYDALEKTEEVIERLENDNRQLRHTIEVVLK